MSNKIETNKQVPRERAPLARASSQPRNTGPHNPNFTEAAAAAKGRGKTIHYFFSQNKIPSPKRRNRTSLNHANKLHRTVELRSKSPPWHRSCQPTSRTPYSTLAMAISYTYIQRKHTSQIDLYETGGGTVFGRFLMFSHFFVVCFPNKIGNICRKIRTCLPDTFLPSGVHLEAKLKRKRETNKQTQGQEQSRYTYRVKAGM